MESCAECGAPVPEGGACRDHLHALLALEWEIPGGPGELAHFFAVASYGLQHPRGIGYTGEVYGGLRSGVVDALAGRVTMEQLRQRARDGARRAGRVTRREGDPVPSPRVAAWPMTVVDALASPPERAAYAERVSAWASSIVEALDHTPPPTSV